MKKRLAALLLCFSCAVSMTACGSDNTDGTEIPNGTDTQTAADTEDNMPRPNLAKYSFDYADYVTLADYSAIPIELSESYEVTEEDVESYIKEWFDYYAPFYVADESKTIIEAGDIVNVNYVGTLDGTAFQGGSAEGQLLDVSNNSSADGSTSFIDGFTDGLLGAEVGSEVACDVTFPENYSEELGGKAVVFTFTVNSIQKKITTFEELNDEVAKTYAGVENVDEMYRVVREGLTDEADYYKFDEQRTVISDYLIENSTVEIPSDYFADLLEAYREMYIYEHCNGDEAQLEEYLSANEGYTLEQAEENWKEMLTKEVKLEFILGAIAQELEISFDEEGYEAELADLLSYYGMTDNTLILESYGYGDLIYGENRLKALHLQEDVFEKLIETAAITIAQPTEE